MDPWRKQLLSILQTSRDDVVRRSTDVALAWDDSPMARPDVEQLIRACLAVIEEGVAGDAKDVRAGFLLALQDVARTTTWELTMKTGLPCWGVIVAELGIRSEAQHRDRVVVWLSRFMGEWWSEVSKVMLPIFIAEQKL